MEQRELVYEGKAKRLYKTDDKEVIWVAYKDSATAFNGEKKATITGKGELNNAITTLLFEKLRASGIESHFLKKISPTEQLVKHVTIIPLEVVVRNVIAGSLSKRLGLPEGTPLKHSIIEFYYKNDELGDPIVNEDHIRELDIATPTELAEIREIARKVNDVLIDHFASCNVRLIDFKMEFGKTSDGHLLLADEISPDTCRLWDKDTNEKLDKDVFRRDLGDLTAAYKKILARLGGEECIK